MGREWAARCEHIPFGLVQIGKQGIDDGTREDVREDRLARRQRDPVEGRSSREAERRVRALLAEINPELTRRGARPVARQVGHRRRAVREPRLAARQGRRVRVGPRDRAVGRLRPVHPVQPRALRIDPAQGRRAARAARDRRLHEAHAPTPSGRSRAGCSTSRRRSSRRRRSASRTSSVTTCSSSPASSRAGTRAGNGDASLRVLCDDVPTRDARLALVAAVQAVLGEGLSLLGLAAPDQM